MSPTKSTSTKNKNSHRSRVLKASKSKKKALKKDQKRKEIETGRNNEEPLAYASSGYWSSQSNCSAIPFNKVSLSSLCNSPVRLHHSQPSAVNNRVKRPIKEKVAIKSTFTLKQVEDQVSEKFAKKDFLPQINKDGASDAGMNRDVTFESKHIFNTKSNPRKRLEDSFENVNDEQSPSQFDTAFYEQENNDQEANLPGDKFIFNDESPVSRNSYVATDVVMEKTKPKFFDQTTGFPNSGNKCYFISVLQCLLRIPTDFRDIIKTIHREWEATHAKKFPENTLIDNLIKILEDDISDESLLKKKLRTIIDICSNGPTKFNDTNQEDAHEFLLHFLFDCFEREISKYGNISLLTTFKSLFKFETRTNMRCIKCKSIASGVTDTQNALSISICDEPGLSLQNLINRYFEVETVNDGTECNKCKCKNMEHLHFIENPPKFLIIHLMRFSYKDNAIVKLSTRVKVSIYLNLDCATNKYAAANGVLVENTVRSPLKSIENKHLAAKNEDTLKLVKFSTKPLINCNNSMQAQQSNFAALKPMKCVKSISLKGGVSLPENEAKTKEAAFDNLGNETQTSQAIEEPYVLDQLTFEEQIVLAERESLKDQDNDNDYRKALALSMIEIEQPRSTDSQEFDFPNDTLDLEEDKEDESKGQYRLMGIVNHIGQYVSSGHYTAVVCDPEKKIWHKYNDEIHSELDEKELKSSCQSKGYLFFYVKK